jgi:hypothetical protein
MPAEPGCQDRTCPVFACSGFPRRRIFEAAALLPRLVQIVEDHFETLNFGVLSIVVYS